MSLHLAVDRVRRFGAGAWRILASNPNAAVFFAGLGVLCGSVAQWSGPLAGTIGGFTLMAVSAWPFLVRKGDS